VQNQYNSKPAQQKQCPTSFTAMTGTNFIKSADSSNKVLITSSQNPPLKSAPKSKKSASKSKKSAPKSAQKGASTVSTNNPITTNAQTGVQAVDLAIDVPGRDHANADSAVRQARTRVRWGEMTEIDEIRTVIDAAYAKIVTWKKNLFDVPTSKCGKDFVKEATRLLQHFNTRSEMEPVAINLLIIFVPLMLQKPARRSKAGDHKRYLAKRLQWWKDGNISELLAEDDEIQKRMQSSKRNEKESTLRGFTRLMAEGKVKQALKLFDADNEITGIHTLNERVQHLLREKHPESEEVNPDAIIQGEAPQVQGVIFEEIGAAAIQSAAKNVHGSGGPTHADADLWKHVLCSKRFGKLSDDLASEIAIATRRLCVEDVPHPYINLLLDCRLVPLMKEDNGVRPIGIGECLRRIMGRSVAKVLGGDVQSAGGTLQTCTGVEAGIEASIHAMARIFDDDKCEAVILVDAENAFNRLNRKTSLQNIQHLCPPLFQFLNNTYKEPAKLHLGDGTVIMSEEGATQGDPLAMQMYAVSSRKIIDSLHDNTRDVDQVWFADDSAGAGGLDDVFNWWMHLNQIGPMYGYYPNPPKTHVILKSPELQERARVLFGPHVKITIEGKRHIGAALGSEGFKSSYIRGKVEKWMKDLEELVEIAKEEPQAALCAFNTGLSQRWTFVQRTMGGIGALFQPLEDVIRQRLIPALCGRLVTDLERRMLALPYRHGGLGIRNPVVTADNAYEASVRITQPLADLIVQQEMDLSKLDRESVRVIKKEVAAERERAFVAEAKTIAGELDVKVKRLLMCAQEKGASAWLAALPLKKLGYSINKQEFRDALCLRYGWKINDMPTHCACGEVNSVDHVLVCRRGGYVIMRHNALRDTEAKIMEQVCTDVRVEPALLETDAPNVRPDVSARGVWSRYEKTFFDVMVKHPTADSYMNKSLANLYSEGEAEKKRKYNDRVINVEHASFTPLVFLTTGGMAPECCRLNKRLAELISAKTGETYSHVIRHVRTRLRFALLRATLIAVRGVRGRRGAVDEEINLDEISFNLIPQADDI
jgi:hypothetical protein